MKRLVSMVLCLLLVMAVAVPVAAAPGDDRGKGWITSWVSVLDVIYGLVFGQAESAADPESAEPDDFDQTLSGEEGDDEPPGGGDPGIGPLIDPNG